MSEKLHHHSPEKHQDNVEIKAEAPKAAEYGKAERHNDIKNAQEAVLAAEHGRSEKTVIAPVIDDPKPQFIDNIAKKLRLNKNIKKVQSKLTPRQRAFSKVVHAPTVQKVSEASAKTVARPSGLFGGGLVAFIGSSAYLAYAHYIGFTYSFFVFLPLFVIGFLIGVLGEYAVFAFKHKK